MLTSKKYQNKRIAIYGMGKTGFSAAKTLVKLGAKISCWDDDSNIRRKITKSKFPLNKFWLKQNFQDSIVVSPGIDINKCKIKKYLKKNLNKIITDLDIFFVFNNDVPIISITGTNGKSTTCKIIEKILKTARYNVKTVGNIGNPILSLRALKKKYIFILETRLLRTKFCKTLHAHTFYYKSYKGYHYPEM